MTELREKLNNIVEEKNTKVTPENLRAGVEAFGVQGTFTADADATAEDIANGKTAYVNGEKITGTLEVSAGDDTNFISAIDNSMGANVTKLPDELTSLRNYAFYKCNQLKITSIPENVTSIGNYCFYECNQLKLTTIPTSVTSLGTYCFYGCASLKSLTCYGNITKIGAQCFRNSAINNLILPNITSVPTFGSMALDDTPLYNKKGYVYVPDTMVSQFKSATGWSYCPIKGISEWIE